MDTAWDNLLSLLSSAYVCLWGAFLSGSTSIKITGDKVDKGMLSFEAHHIIHSPQTKRTNKIPSTDEVLLTKTFVGSESPWFWFVMMRTETWTMMGGLARLLLF